MAKLTTAGIKAIKEPGRYHDGNGLMLVRSGNGAASWIVRMQVSGKRREFGLGSCKDVGLAEARDRAADIRKQYRSGVDPVAERQASERVFLPSAKLLKSTTRSLREAGRTVSIKLSG